MAQHYKQNLLDLSNDLLSEVDPSATAGGTDLIPLIDPLYPWAHGPGVTRGAHGGTSLQFQITVLQSPSLKRAA